MDTDTDQYDADGFYTGTDPLSGHDQMDAPTAPSHDITHSVEPGELANLLNAAGMFHQNPGFSNPRNTN